MKFKLLILPASLLIGLLVFLYFIQPEWTVYSENKNTLASTKNDLEDIKNNQNKFSQALESYNSISSDNKILIKRTIPETILEEDFLYNLNLALNKTGAILTKAELSQEKPLKSRADSDENLDLKKTEISLNVLGNYFQLRTLLYSIENLDRLVGVNEMSIKKNQENQGTEDLELSLKLTILNRNTFPNLEISLKDHYLNSILKDGLDLELVNNYKEYRGEASSFDFIGENIPERDDLFGSAGGNGTSLDSENEEVIEETEDNISENIE